MHCDTAGHQSRKADEIAEQMGGERMRIEAKAGENPHVEGHPNRVPFEGVLTVVNAASDKAPAGARGHRVMLTREAAEKALPSLLGMAVDYRPGWDGHDARRKIGLLTEADLIGQRLVVRGYLYARDFPEVAGAIQAQAPIYSSPSRSVPVAGAIQAQAPNAMGMS